MCEATNVGIIVLRCVYLQPQAGTLTQVELDLQSSRKRVGLVNVGAYTILEVTVVLIRQKRKACTRPITQSTTDCGLQSLLVVLAYRHIGVGIKITAGLDGEIMHEAASGVAAEQRPLWAAQHFHTLDIEQLETRRAQRPYIGFIDIDRSRSFMVVAEVVLADTANGKQHDSRVSRERCTLKAGCLIREAFAGVDTQVMYGLARESRDGNADILGRLFALLRGDDDLLDFLGECGERQKPQHE